MAANTYSGATNVAQGALQAGAVDVLDNSSGLNITASGASFNLAGLDQTIARLDGVAGGIVTNNSAAVGDAATLTIAAGGGSYAGDLTETGGDTLALTKSGSGTQTLNVGTGTYNGATLISGGHPARGLDRQPRHHGRRHHRQRRHAGRGLHRHCQRKPGLERQRVMAAPAPCRAATPAPWRAASILPAPRPSMSTTARPATSISPSAAISAARAASTLTKLGPDTLVLSGNNSYAGITQIDAGVLKLGATSGIGNASVVNIAAGATFDVNDQNATIGSLGGGSGTLDLGLGSLAASDDIDLTGITVVIAAAGSGNQTLRAGSDGSGSLIVDALTKSSTGNLTLIAPTLIDINGDVAVNAGNLSINNAFNAAGDLTASGTSA